ncbi:MAG: efflux RND transporter permease subunit [Alphaproteobacteria bacterium]
MIHDRMDVSSLGVRRPVLAVVLNLLIIVAGAAALMGVEIRELPNVDRPIVTVRADYPGASPETVDTQVTSVIEGAVARVPGIVSLSSSSDYGDSRVTLEFDTDVDLNVAAADVRDAVGRAQRSLPDGVETPAVVKADADSQPIIRLSISSDRRSASELTTLVEDLIADAMAAVPGVADVQVYGATTQVVRVVVDPFALASRSLSLADLADALGDSALDVPAGTLETAAQELIVRADATVTTAAQIEAIAIDRRTRIGDVATVFFGPQDRTSSVRLDGQSVIGLGLIRQPQSNTIAISAAVDAVIERLAVAMPDVTIDKSSDDAVFIEGAITEVAKTLLLSVLIVTAVIYLFVGSARATLIPLVSMPVALIGTVAAIWLLGYSVNILTLLALVLATGMVVDDAIVVLENIERQRARGLRPRAAAVVGTREVFFAVIATTATLAAVFVPISFLPGTAGRLFTEFGFVLAFAVIISSFVALSLCPMLAARLPGRKPDAEGKRLLPRLGHRAARTYAWTLDRALAAPLVTLALAGVVAFAAWGVFSSLSEELLPPEDRGTVFIGVDAPPGAGLAFTDAQVDKVEAILQPLVDSGEATNMFSIVGRGSSNSAFVILRLADWGSRARSQQEIVSEIRPALSVIPGAQVFLRAPNSLGIRGGGSGLAIALTGGDYDRIAAAADALALAAEARPEIFESLDVDYDTNQPQLSVLIDRERASDLGIPLDDVGSALRAMIQGDTVAEIFVEGEAIDVVLQSAAGIIDDPADLENLYIRSGAGRILPLSSIVSLRESAIAPELDREGQRRAISVSVALAGDTPLRTGMEAIQELAADVLPGDIELMFAGDAATLDQTSSGVAITFGIALLVVLLVLAAQFESFASAAVVIATVPFGIAAALLALYVTGSSINIYSQIGLVMLIGLLAKNGILIVEFANQMRDRGLGVHDAVREAAVIRLRPVMMTMTSTVLGGLPLVLSSGPGAEARQSIGWIVVGGLGFATLFTLFLTPVAYILIARFSKARASESQRLREELAEHMPPADNDEAAALALRRAAE